MTQKDEDMIADAVANNGPVSICYDVAQDFMHYKNGVYKRYVVNNEHAQYMFHTLISTKCKDGNENVNHAGKGKGWLAVIMKDSYHFIQCWLWATTRQVMGNNTGL